MTKSYKQTHKYKKFKYTVKTNMYDIHLNKVNIYQKKWKLYNNTPKEEICTILVYT